MRPPGIGGLAEVFVRDVVARARGRVLRSGGSADRSVDDVGAGSAGHDVSGAAGR